MLMGFCFACGAVDGSHWNRVGLRACNHLVGASRRWTHAPRSHSVCFGVALTGLGIGEAGNFPAAIKTVAEWFPKKERAFATGIFNEGSNVGAIIAPLTVPWIARQMGWQLGIIGQALSAFCG